MKRRDYDGYDGPRDMQGLPPRRRRSSRERRERWGYPLLLLAVLAVCALLLAHACTAIAAEPFVPGEQRSLALAVQTWHPPCSGVAVEPMAASTFDVQRAAGRGADEVLGVAFVGDCRVELNWPLIRDVADNQDSGYGRAAVERWHERTFACTVIVHEVGHLAGQEHSTDPHSVMYAQLLHTYAPCRALFPKPRPSRHARHLVPDPAPSK